MKGRAEGAAFLFAVFFESCGPGATAMVGERACRHNVGQAGRAVPAGGVG
jgi:hypothetical protein